MASAEKPKPERGFPNPEKQTALFLNFCHNYRPQISNYIDHRLPDWHPTDNQFFLLMMIYYGVYFYDHVSGGDILSGRTTANEYSRQFRQISRLPPITYPRLIKGLIPHWPVNLYYGSPDQCPSASIYGLIGIPVRAIPDIDPFESRLFYYRYYKNPLRQLLYNLSGRIHDKNSSYPSLPLLEQGIFIGIEEAQHSHFWYLENRHYGNQLDDVNLVVGPLKSYLTTKTAKTAPDLDHHLKCCAGIGAEFAAHIVRAAYIQKYHSEIWAFGYRDYVAAVENHRRRLIATTKPICQS